MPRFTPLTDNMTTDVVVVGGGITGLTAAYLLTRAGCSVVLLERGRLASIDTGHTTAHLTMVTDERLSDLERVFARNHAQAAWDAGLAAIEQIERTANDERIACDFARVPAFLHAVRGGSHEDVARLRDEASIAEALGFDAEFVNVVPLAHLPGVRYERQARFHPRKYRAGLARAIAERGGLIFEDTSADEFKDDPMLVKANGHIVSCDYVVLATHNPLVGTSGLASATLFQTKLALYTSYAVAGHVKKGSVPDALLWDTADPYHYFRLEPGERDDVVVYGGEDHKTGQSDDTAACFDRLERALVALVPEIDVSHRWSGQVIETADGLPYIGETAEHQFVATGFSGNGMTFGTLAGMMAADYVQDKGNPWAELFDPGRKTLRGAAWDYIKENKDYPYYLIRDRFAGAETKSLRSVEPGAGKIVEYNGEQVAVFRDRQGRVQACSAVCTHMGCLVDWNEAEQTWDCPCHGSRFQTDGKVIAGPAESPLHKIDVPDR